VRTRVSSKGRIVLPAEIRRQDEVEAGQEFEVERLDRGEYRLVRGDPQHHGFPLGRLLGREPLDA